MNSLSQLIISHKRKRVAEENEKKEGVTKKSTRSFFASVKKSYLPSTGERKLLEISDVIERKVQRCVTSHPFTALSLSLSLSPFQIA